MICSSHRLLVLKPSASIGVYTSEINWSIRGSYDVASRSVVLPLCKTIRIAGNRLLYHAQPHSQTDSI